MVAAQDRLTWVVIAGHWCLRGLESDLVPGTVVCVEHPTYTQLKAFQVTSAVEQYVFGDERRVSARVCALVVADA